MIPQVKADVEVLGWPGYLHIVCGCEVGHTATFSKTTLEAAYGREINIQLSGNVSGGHSCSQYANRTLPQLETTVALCCVPKLHFLVAFYCPQYKVHLCNDHAF